MSALDHDIQEMFRRREADVRAPQRAPSEVVRRVRRRQVGTVVAGVLAGVVLLVASFAAVRSIAVSTQEPANHGSPSSAPVGEQAHWYRIASAAGTALGGPWHFTAAHNMSGRLCLVFRTPSGAFRVCGEMPGAADFAGLLRPYTGQLGYARGAAVFGVVSGRAARVLIRLDGGGTAVARIVSGREAAFGFFVAILDHPRHGTVLAVDSSGRVFSSRRV